jgi:hypothetical protein
MQYMIITFGAVIAMAGLVMVIAPQMLLGMLQKNASKSLLFAFAVIVRLVLGALLIAYASKSAFPLTLQFLGWIAVAAAVAMLVAGRERLGRLIGWVISVASHYARPAGILAVLFGAFLIYAVR